ncbi:hypothetical protein VTL71DRAFT_2297 [Oculimacula yallundae]|uniref:Uncharacterized protein n=1 Tax=Oculimacula yallundae TaxID=86028 RepID=A0ABR4CAF1_9HELO
MSCRIEQASKVREILEDKATTSTNIFVYLTVSANFIRSSGSLDSRYSGTISSSFDLYSTTISELCTLILEYGYIWINLSLPHLDFRSISVSCYLTSSPFCFTLHEERIQAIRFHPNMPGCTGVHGCSSAMNFAAVDSLKP